MGATLKQETSSRPFGDAGAIGQVTGFQTVNTIDTASVMEVSLGRAFNRTNAVFVEVYEDAFDTLKGEDLSSDTGVQGFSHWNEKFHDRRRSSGQSAAWQALGDPQPLMHAHIFHHVDVGQAARIGPSPNFLQYVHGSKCDEQAPVIGSITISAPAQQRASR